MKIPTIISAFLLITCLTVEGQTYFPFPEGNAHWNVYLESSGQHNPPTDTTLLRYALHGDTTINDVLYMKLCLEKGDTISPVLEPIGGLREDEKRVFFIGQDFIGYSHDEEILLYDFNKQLDDTIFHYDNTFSVILGIDSMLIGDDYRKRYEVDVKYGKHHPDFVVEGIGSVKNGLLGHITMIPTGGYSYWEHVCFRENGEIKYLNPTFSDCFPNFTLNSINHKVGSTSLGIYPNPFLDELRIDNIPVNSRVRILLINTIGQIVLDKELSATNNLVPFHGNTGIYIALIVDNKGLIVKKEKVIKK